MSNNEVDRKDLKIQALLEKVSILSREKENEIADLRVELTVMNQQAEQIINDLRGKVAELEASDGSVPEENDSDSSD